MLARLLTIAALVPMAALAGCLSGDEAPSAEAPLNETGDQVIDATLPDDRGKAIAFDETNKTEEGVGGVDHKHDYWEGKESDLLYEDRVSFFPTPLFPDGEGSSPKNVVYLKLPEGKLVYEGAVRVEFLAGAPQLADGAAHPSPPNLFLQYRSAADADWREPMQVPWGTPLDIPVASKESDMPHSIVSLWVFRLTTDRVESLDTDVKITAYRGGDVVDWPGHPDFYVDRTSRVVMQQHVKTHMSGLESALLYDTGGTWAIPEKLVSWGTDRLEVFINVTNVENAYNADGTGFFLEAHNATIIGPEIVFGKRFFDPDEPTDLKSWNFTIHVHEFGMDGPYQPSSRWGFRAMATFAEVPGVTGLCPGCFPYDIEYDITVIAVKDPELVKEGRLQL